MTTSVDHAAAELLAQLRVPKGAVNTLGVVEKKRGVIRVLVDASYICRLGAVPKVFKGFSVRVEKRGIVEPSDLLLRISS